eukprot:1150326-Pelagomonas_calceolata.AAC.2
MDEVNVQTNFKIALMPCPIIGAWEHGRFIGMNVDLVTMPCSLRLTVWIERPGVRLEIPPTSRSIYVDLTQQPSRFLISNQPCLHEPSMVPSQKKGSTSPQLLGVGLTANMSMIVWMQSAVHSSLSVQ